MNRRPPGWPIRKALCTGAVFAVSTVIPDKILHLAEHLQNSWPLAAAEELEHSLQLLGCFLLLSVLIWASGNEPGPRAPLLSYPPHNRQTLRVHIAGVAMGIVVSVLEMLQ